ncbi:hypothetical protein KL86DPRO_20254 [uncultured delta proteobacterium]|uniref:Uncharacterized protein n=1 Tax=uncultured delta proteobacterium TaxID=34034 RepID=A0A212JXI0_9DELT|nr:hypothetical protein KL86DPRO_20254 [uncultured delta proteobacterium]
MGYNPYNARLFYAARENNAYASTLIL